MEQSFFAILSVVITGIGQELEQSPITYAFCPNEFELNEKAECAPVNECIVLIHESPVLMAILLSSDEFAMVNMHQLINDIRVQNTLIQNSEVISLNKHPNENLDLGWCGNEYFVRNPTKISRSILHIYE